MLGTFTNSGSITGAAGTDIELSGGNVTLTPTSTITADSLSLAASPLNLQINGPTAGSGLPDITANTVAIGGKLNVDLLNGFTPSLGETFTIINNQRSHPISGTFAGSIVNAGSAQFQISYTGGDGNDVILTTTALAKAGCPYTVTYGGSLALDASASGDLNSNALTYSWTINGQANAAAGVQPVLTWAQLQSLGAASGQSFSVSVTISDGNGLVLTSAPVTVTVNQATPTVVVTDVRAGRIMACRTAATASGRGCGHGR